MTKFGTCRLCQTIFAWTIIIDDDDGLLYCSLCYLHVEPINL